MTTATREFLSPLRNDITDDVKHGASKPKPVRPPLTMRPAFNHRLRLSQNRVAQLSSPLSTPAASSPSSGMTVRTPDAPVTPGRTATSEDESPPELLTLPRSDNSAITRYHAFLKDHYTPQELSARLSNSSAPANPDDVRVLHQAAAYANLWVSVDRTFQHFIRERGIDFCTLASAVHIILSRLPPYEYVDADAESEGSLSDDDDEEDDPAPEVERHSIDDVVDPVPLFAELQSPSITGRMFSFSKLSKKDKSDDVNFIGQPEGQAWRVRDDHPPHSPSPCKRRPSDEPSGPPKRPALAPLIGCSLSSRAIRAIRGDSEKSISAKSDKSDKSSSAPEKHSRTRSLLHVSKPKPVRSHSARQPSTYRSPLPSPMPTIEISRAPPLETETVALPPRPRHTRAPNSAPLLARRMPSHLAPPPVPPRSPFRI